jgi:membrane protease YdiL (CAAX protease family)
MIYKKKTIWLTVLPAMILPCIASLFYFVLFSEKLFAQLLYGGTKLFTVLWPALAAFVILRNPFPVKSVDWRKHFKSLPLGMLSGTVIVAAMFALMQTPLGHIARASADNIRHKLAGLGILEHYWLFGLFLAVVHSLVEEYYWRWFVFGRLRNLVPIFWAHILAGAAFASHHVVVTSQFFGFGWGFFVGAAVAAGGIIWSVMYSRQRTLAGPWLSHMIVDLGIEAIGHSILFGAFF